MGTGTFFVAMLTVGIILVVMALRWKPMNWMISFLGITFWLGVGFWFNLTPPWTGITVPDVFSDVLKYLPFLFMIGIVADCINRWGQVEISREIGGRRFTEVGTPPKGYRSGYDRYREQLQGRTRRR